MLRRIVFFALVIAAMLLTARVAERHTFTIDVTARQSNSVSAAAAQALDRLPAPLRIDAYIPDLAVQRAEIEHLLAPYRAHRSDTTLNFIDPVARPDLARAAQVARNGELQLHSGARSEIITRASAAAIDAALNRLARQGERWIVSLRGHGEAAIDNAPGGLQRLVTVLEARGYRVVALDPRQLDRFPDNTALVLVAAPEQAYGEHTQSLLSGHLASGGAVLWLARDTLPVLGDAAEPPGFLSGYVVDAQAARYGLDTPDNAIVDSYPAAMAAMPDVHGVIHRARSLTWQDNNGWREIGRFASSAQSWNETSELRGNLARDPALGEHPGPHTIGLLLQHDQDDHPARLALIAGEFAGNDHLGRAANLALAVALVNWLSGNDLLPTAQPAADLELRWSTGTGATLAIGLMALLPALYLALGLWLRARRRRA